MQYSLRTLILCLLLAGPASRYLAFHWTLWQVHARQEASDAISRIRTRRLLLEARLNREVEIVLREQIRE